MKHTCDKCMYKTIPTSMHDYFVKTFTLPEKPEDWGKDYRKQMFYLCSAPGIAVIDHTNESLIYGKCRENNFNGECHYYREEHAEDIIPSTIKINSEKIAEESEEPIYVGDEVKISITMEPFTRPAVTEERQKLDIDGQPMFDEEGNPFMETVELEPEFVNPQEIKYVYQWYKNDRKLWKEKDAELIVKAKEAGTESYHCVVTQSLEDNGDGGHKEFCSLSDIVDLVIEEKPEEIPEEENGD